MVWDKAMDRVLKGEAAMTIMGDWAKGYANAAGYHSDAFGFIPMPGTAGTFVFTTDTFGLPIGASEDTRKVLNVFGSAEGQKIFNELKGSISARLDVEIADDDDRRPTYDDFVAADAADKVIPATSILAQQAYVDAISAALAELRRQVPQRRRQRRAAHAGQLRRSAALELLARLPEVDADVDSGAVDWWSTGRQSTVDAGARRPPRRERARDRGIRHAACDRCDRRMATLSIDCPLMVPGEYDDETELRRDQPGRVVAQLAGARLDRRGGQRTAASSPGGPRWARRPDTQVRIADREVSRLHAELEPTDRGTWVRDLGSRNGTFVENLQVAAAMLPDGARIRVGGTDVVLRYPARGVAGRAVAGGALRRPDRRQHADARAVRADVARRAERRAGADPGRDRARARSWRRARSTTRRRAPAGPFVIVDCAALASSI